MLPPRCTTGRANVLYLVASLDGSPAARCALELAVGLPRERFCPMVLCVGREGAGAGSAREGGLAVEALGLAGVLDPRGPWRAARVLRYRRARLVHGLGQGVEVLAAAAARLGGIPCVVAGGGPGSGPPRGRMARRALAFLADRVLDGGTWDAARAAATYLEVLRSKSPARVDAPEGPA
ncbi:MAG: hypothetical protein HY722_02035 [Planctomycetes bacterium]|nr:hypothetical protein [Planctomycetota bacterium]